MPKPETIALMLCCNDYRNGSFNGRASGLHVDTPGGEELSLESPYFDRHLRCAIDERTFRLGKDRTWPHRGHREWVGNWCWDVVHVTPEVAAEVLNFAAAKGYRPEMGTERLWGRIERQEAFIAADFMEEQHA